MAAVHRFSIWRNAPCTVVAFPDDAAAEAGFGDPVDEASFGREAADFGAGVGEDEVFSVGVDTVVSEAAVAVGEGDGVSVGEGSDAVTGGESSEGVSDGESTGSCAKAKAAPIKAIAVLTRSLVFIWFVLV